MLRSTFLRAAVAAFLIGLASTSASVAASPATPVTVRLGFLRGPEPLSISRLRGTLEKRLAARNVKVAWVGPFIAYAPAAEALNANAIDITIGSSSAAISSLVGTAPISLFAYQWDAGDSSGIVVRNGSDIKTVADLAGRSVAVNRGGTGDYQLTKALEKAGVPSSGVKRAFLSPVDSAAAFASGHVDAWSAWSIFFPTALVDGDARVIAQASDFGSQNAVVYVVRTPFAAEHPDILKDVLEDLRESARWAHQNREEAARLWVQELKLSPAVATRVANYRNDEPVPVGEKELVALESLNDWLVGSKLLPKPAAIKDHVIAVGR
ncbi:aliphatic sulfonate ABC transporter substrate-binding protein [Tardiphaga sp. 619_E2_N8_5]|uniref:aliphatic sulfonate ABC transporter substrate-binding protein n=1 Tax=unclassified Tardiphaga TaxID=2631404 RepID=UPI003F232949